MKTAVKRVIAFLKVAVICGLGFSSVLGYGSARERAAKKAISSAVPALESYREKHGRYPATLENIPMQSAAVLGFLPGAEISYRVNDAGYVMTYYMLPLGPWHGYASESKSWIYEE